MMSDEEISARLGKVKEEIKKAIPPTTTEEDKKMSSKKKVSKKVAAKKAPAKKAPAKKAAVKKVSAKKTDSNKAAAPQKSKTSDDGRVTIEALAKEAKLSSQVARRKLRASKVSRDAGRWSWEEGSAALKAARTALGL